MNTRKDAAVLPQLGTNQLHETAANFAQGIVNLQADLERTKSALQQADAEVAMLMTEREQLRSDNSRMEGKLSFYMQRTTELLTRLHTVYDIINKSLNEEPMGEYHRVAAPSTLTTEQQKGILDDIEAQVAERPLPGIVAKGPRVPL